LNKEENFADLAEEDGDFFLFCMVETKVNPKIKFLKTLKFLKHDESLFFKS
jgi:hypothetical protein